MVGTAQAHRLTSGARPGRPEKYPAEQVLNTALNLYWTDGVSGLSVNDLVRRMGIPKPSLYRHFPSEDALQASVLLAYEASALARLNEVMTQPASFEVQMTAWTDILIEGIKAHQKGCLLFQMREQQHLLGPQARRTCDEVFTRYRNGVHNWLSAAVQNGEITLQTEITLATQLVLGLITLVRNGFRDGLDDNSVHMLAAAYMRAVVKLNSPAAA